MNSPVEDPTLRWMLAAIFSALGVIFIWIYHHSVRDAKREARVDELTKEVGHPTVKGSILERLHRYSGRIRRMWEHLNLKDDDE